MRKFDVGDKVKVVNSRRQNGTYCSYTAGLIGEVGVITEICQSPYPYAVRTSSTPRAIFIEDDLERISDMDNLKQGDVLVKGNYSYERVVQGTMGEVVFTIDSDDHCAEGNSIQELRSDGWKLKAEESPTTELTLKDVAEKFGLDVDKVRIKES